MIVIVNISPQKFSLNGIPYFKNFTPHVIGGKLRIVNTYDSRLSLCEFNSPDNFTVDGVSYGDIQTLQNVLLPVLYSRNTLGNSTSFEELDRIVSVGSTTVVSNEVTFGVGFQWMIATILNANTNAVTRNLPLASPGMFRRHTAYLTNTSTIQIQVGIESETILPETEIPAGTLRLRDFIIFGETIQQTIGPSSSIDINLLDELNQDVKDEDWLFVNVAGIDYKTSKNKISEDFIDIESNITLSNAHFNKILRVSGAITITIPNSGLRKNFRLYTDVLTGSSLAWATATGVVLTGNSSTNQTENTMSMLYKIGTTNNFRLRGDI